MSTLRPTVTVIIAARPDEAVVGAVAAARGLQWPAGSLEILVARGRQPSVQRNTALRQARGEWIYFLDDDSLPDPENLRRVEVLLSDSAVQMIGGPNLCPADAPLLERVFAVVLSSWLAFGPSRARYARVGKARNSGEKELILCNLMARRDSILALGGFNEALYPNEENDLMDQLQKCGGRLVYDPDFCVQRRPRRSLASFLKMLRTYGRGRAEQFRVNPTPGSALNFIPPLFCVYLLALTGVELAPFAGPGAAALRRFSAVPVAIYALALAVQTTASVREHGWRRSLLAQPLLVASHLFYGCGFWLGLFTSLKRGADRPRFEVVLETINP